MIRALICKLPVWLGGGHRWRRLTVKERLSPGFQVFAASHGGTVATMRRCRRCGAERIVKARKAKEIKQESGT